MDTAVVTPTVRLPHEALISRWQRARDQLAGGEARCNTVFVDA
jgi:hypothetical protein